MSDENLMFFCPSCPKRCCMSDCSSISKLDNMVLLLHNPCSPITIYITCIDLSCRRQINKGMQDLHIWWLVNTLATPKSRTVQRGALSWQERPTWAKPYHHKKRGEGCIGLKYIESIFIDTEVPMWFLLQKESALKTEILWRKLCGDVSGTDKVSRSRLVWGNFSRKEGGRGLGDGVAFLEPQGRFAQQGCYKAGALLPEQPCKA